MLLNLGLIEVSLQFLFPSETANGTLEHKYRRSYEKHFESGTVKNSEYTKERKKEPEAL